MVPRAVDQLEARLGNQRVVNPAVGRFHDPVAGAPHDERRDRDAAQPALELGIVHVRAPAVEAEGFPVASTDDELVIGQSIQVGRPGRGIVPASPMDLLRRGIEDVEMAGVSRSLTLMPNASTSTSPSSRWRHLTASSAASQPPNDKPINVT